MNTLDQQIHDFECTTLALFHDLARSGKSTEALRVLEQGNTFIAMVKRLQDIHIYKQFSKEAVCQE